MAADPYRDIPWCRRRSLPHRRPAWVDFEGRYLLTVCSKPRGVNQLARADVAFTVWRTLLHHHEHGAWRLHAAVVMPDHIHLLVSVRPTIDLGRLVPNWKRYLARFHKVAWQRDFFEWRLRGDDRLEEKVEYLKLNPVRAGLAATPEDWPWFFHT